MSSSRIRRRAATLLVPLALAGLPGLAGVAGAQAPAPTAGPVAAQVPSVEPALDWLAGELDANGSSIPSSFGGGFVDWGLTADVILALAAGGEGGGASAQAATATLLANAPSYVTDADFGAGNERYAGALGKLLLVTLVQGEDPANVGGLDLEAELRARMVATGPATGRFVDLSTFGDFSNGLGQAFDVLALGRTASGVPAEAVAFLLAQQCPAGGFRAAYTTGLACTADSSADPDATGLAVDALLALPPTPAVTAAVTAAVTWLSARQAADGSFSGGPSSTANANTTGLVAVALRAAGKGAAANRAAAWVTSVQLSQPGAGSGPAAADVGAIAYDPAGRDAALAAGISSGARDQFRRATAQASLALGLPSYGNIGDTAPVDPAPVASLSSPDGPLTGLTAGANVVVTAGGFTPGEAVAATVYSDPVSLGSHVAAGNGTVSFSFALPADLDAGAHRLELVGQLSGVVVAATFQVAATLAPVAATPTAGPVAQLPATGATTTALAEVGFTVFGMGALLVALSRRRPVRAPR